MNKQISVWTQPDATHESGYGHVTYRQWCELEIKRFATHGQAVYIITRKDGCIALSREKPPARRGKGKGLK